MTNPPHPGQPPYPPGPGSGPPYGPPPQRQVGDHPGARPGSSGQDSGFGETNPGAHGLPAQKGLVGALLDVNFNHLVTPKLIKMFYVLALMLVTVSALSVAAIGLWIFQLRNGWLLGGLVIIAAPVIWIFEALMVRIVMEAIIVRFKSTEYLRSIKDKL